MTFIQGDGGGVVFRYDESKGTGYLFRVASDGSFYLNILNNNNVISVISSGTNSAINIGLNQSNLIAVVANGSNIDLYVNNQQVDSASDSSYSQGEIGVAASDVSNQTEAVFSNAKVWTL